MNVEQEFNNLFVKDACTINASLLNAPSTILDWIQENFTPKVSRVELPVKPACENCIHLKVEGGKLYAKTELCQNGKIRLWNLTNCDIDTTEFGCTYFESKSV